LGGWQEHRSMTRANIHCSDVIPENKVKK